MDFWKEMQRAVAGALLRCTLRKSRLPGLFPAPITGLPFRPTRRAVATSTSHSQLCYEYCESTAAVPYITSLVNKSSTVVPPDPTVYATHSLLTWPSNWPIARVPAPTSPSECSRPEALPALPSRRSSVRPSSWLLNLRLRLHPLRYIPSGKAEKQKASERGAPPFGYRSCAETRKSLRVHRLSPCWQKRRIHGRRRGHDCPLRASYGIFCGIRGPC